jgi:hypothetical protein
MIVDKPKPANPLRAARAEGFLRVVKRNHYGLLLDRDEYRYLRDDGWTRASVEQAVNDLVADGRVSVDTGHGGALRVRAVETTAGREEAGA